MSVTSEQPSVHDTIKLFFGKVWEELYGTKERTRNTIGVAFLTLVLLRIGGYIGEADPILGAAC